MSMCNANRFFRAFFPTNSDGTIFGKIVYAFAPRRGRFETGDCSPGNLTLCYLLHLRDTEDVRGMMCKSARNLETISIVKCWMQQKMKIGEDENVFWKSNCKRSWEWMWYQLNSLKNLIREPVWAPEHRKGTDMCHFRQLWCQVLVS